MKAEETLAKEWWKEIRRKCHQVIDKFGLDSNTEKKSSFASGQDS